MKNAALILVFLLCFQAVAAASNGNWPFDLYPQPEYRELSGPELKTLDEAEHSDDWRPCISLIGGYYQIYLGRYPDFASWADSNLRYNAWKNHVIHSHPDLFNSCLALNLLFEIMKISPKMLSLHFCGHYRREPYTLIEKQAAELIDELFLLATIDPDSAASRLIGAHAATRVVNLDPEVEYYFAKLTSGFYKKEPSREAIAYLALKPPEFRERLDRAVSERDIETVLEMAGECGPD